MAPDLWSRWTGDKPVSLRGDISTMNAQMTAGRESAAGPAPRRPLTPLAAIDPRDAARTAARVMETAGRPSAKRVTFNSTV